jgi:hypothetical protein
MGGTLRERTILFQCMLVAQGDKYEAFQNKQIKRNVLRKWATVILRDGEYL